MKNKKGFTLIELLVVLAIIAILMAITVPNVITYIKKGNMVKAHAEIRSIELALTKMLTDTGKSDFRQFANFKVKTFTSLQQAEEYYTNFFYTLLRQGRNAEGAAVGEWNEDDENESILTQDVMAKLGESYIDIGLDPWGNKYRFMVGPWKYGKITLRSFRESVNNYGPDDPEPYRYSAYAKRIEDDKLPGNPRTDGEWGFPAPRNETMYIYSIGENMQGDQLHGGQGYIQQDREYLGGGDDISSWDQKAGWTKFYN